MTPKHTLVHLSTLLLVLLATSCRNGDRSEPSAAEEPAAAEAPATAGEATADSPAADVSYEPAYPADVSEEGLSEEDAAQQQTTHAHGGEEHSHAEEDGHAHGEGEGEHSHDDGGHDDHDH